MQTNVYLPQLELTMAEVTVATIHVAVGDLVAEEQPLIDVETEKALVPVPAPKGGFVRFLFVKAGEQLAENALLCILTDTPNEPFEPPAGPDVTGPAAPGPRRSSPREQARPSDPAGLEPPEGGVKAAPAARKLARERGLDLNAIKGTGPGGRITVDDVRNAS